MNTAPEKIPAPKKISSEYLEKVMDYDTYKKKIEDLLAAGKATGPVQSEALTHYSTLNVQRMRRLDKTIETDPAAMERMAQVARPQTWLVLTEGWCGDAAQSIPVMEALTRGNPKIKLRYLLRDENPELMDQYLLNGISRSIPKLIAVDDKTQEELFNWGPRPAPLQELFYIKKEAGVPYATIKEEGQRWYNQDRALTIQQEISGLVSGEADPGPR